MRARPDILPHLIARRMEYWLGITRCPLVNIRVPMWRARKNYRNLVRKYPLIASALGYSEALSYPSPLHGLPRSAVPQPAEPPLIEQPAEPPAAVLTPACPSPATMRVPQTVLFDDEVV